MAHPPRDASGNVIPHDDLGIQNDDGLIRHINPDHHVVFDKNAGCNKLSSGAFSESSNPPGGMSVNLERSMKAAGLNSLDMLPNSDFGAVRLIAGDMRELGHRVGSDPLPDNPYHGAVWDIKGRKARKRIMERAEWLKKPDKLG